MSIRAPRHPSNGSISLLAPSDASYPGRENADSPSGTIRRHESHRASSSISTLPLQVRNDNLISPTANFLSTLSLEEESTNGSASKKLAGHAPQAAHWKGGIQSVSNLVISSIPGIMIDDVEVECIDAKRVELDSSLAPVRRRSSQREPFPRLSFTMEEEELSSSEHLERRHISSVDHSPKPNPFRRWMDTLHRKSVNKRNNFRARQPRGSFDDVNNEPEIMSDKTPARGITRHRKSSSWSSNGFVTAVKSVSMSLATLSVAPQSRKNRGLRSSNRSSMLSYSQKRSSTDDGPMRAMATRVMDEASRERAIKRRRTMDELMNSEESYVADLKVLVNVYFTLLASAPMPSHHNLKHIHENITEILVLHENLVAQIRHNTYSSSNRIDPNNFSSSLKPPIGTRRHSVDASLSSQNKRFVVNARRRSYDVSGSKQAHDNTILAEPEDAAAIARIFGSLMGSFFVYEEYGARYESMLYDMTVTSKSIPNFQAYERGIEALANTLAPIESRVGNNRKGLTFGDLLIKPIQRVCKYPLLFADLYKHTPVIDCPESHAEIEKCLFRLRETAMEINKATNDEDTQQRIQRSWHLQDLLRFAELSAAPYSLRSLGHAVLCGVLHVAYQSKQRVLGEYMLCALFNSCLILGLPNENGRYYKIVASISLIDLRIEATDNGKGLQCFTALYSWKIVFEADQQLFELILSACSAQEEQQWKQSLFALSSKASQTQFDGHPISPEQYSVLSMDLKAIGNVLGQPGTLARRISVQRAATMGPRTSVCQVIIKNTHALRDSIDSSHPGTISVGRSQSLLSTNRIPVLAPKRVERMRMEHELAKVWTREFLPYPGMNGNRGDHLIRASASSMIRKFSKASLASGFSKRSVSFTSFTNSKFEEPREAMGTVEQPDCTARLAGTPEKRDSPLPKTGFYGIVPQRTSSSNGTTLRGKPFDKGRHRTPVSTYYAVDQSQVRRSPSRAGRTVKHRWSSPFPLFRSISTEALKSFFT